MSINTLFGINGVGKDTVANELRRVEERNLTITSMSRTCMYLLGIIDSHDVSAQVGRDSYYKLEQVPQPEMIKLEGELYREFIEQMAHDEGETLFLSHLVSALHLGKTVRYLTERTTPDWFIECNSNLIQLKAPPESILERRRDDSENGTRSRPIQLKQIIEHQELCDNEWERIESGVIKPKRGMVIVENEDLSTAVAKTREVLYG